MSRDQALALLMAAHDGGIPHFDTAPFYSWGAAEEVLGAFAAGKTDLTIVTKAGIAPPSKAARLIAKAPSVPAARRHNREEQCAPVCDQNSGVARGGDAVEPLDPRRCKRSGGRRQVHQCQQPQASLVAISIVGSIAHVELCAILASDAFKK